MDPRLFGEFMGTLVLVLMGNGVVANVVLKKTLGSAAGWLTIVFGYRRGGGGGSLHRDCLRQRRRSHQSSRHARVCDLRRGDFSKFVPFLIAQVLGGFVGGMLVWIHFLPHWAETPDAGSKLACFSTGPAIRNTVGQSHQRNHRHVSAGVDWLHAMVKTSTSAGISARSWSAQWCGPSAPAWEAPPDSPLIPRAIWARASRTRSCRFPAKAARISVTASPSRFWAG